MVWRLKLALHSQIQFNILSRTLDFTYSKDWLRSEIVLEPIWTFPEVESMQLYIARTFHYEFTWLWTHHILYCTYTQHISSKMSWILVLFTGFDGYDGISSTNKRWADFFFFFLTAVFYTRQFPPALFFWLCLILVHTPQ